MLNRDYPIILGLKRNGKHTKAGIGVKSQMGSGYDVIICGMKEDHPDIETCSKEELRNSLDGQVYTRLHFCNMEALDDVIRLLQDTKKLWENEQKEKKS